MLRLPRYLNVVHLLGRSLRTALHIYGSQAFTPLRSIDKSREYLNLQSSSQGRTGVVADLLGGIAYPEMHFAFISRAFWSIVKLPRRALRVHGLPKSVVSRPLDNLRGSQAFTPPPAESLFHLRSLPASPSYARVALGLLDRWRLHTSTDHGLFTTSPNRVSPLPDCYL
jgi:hypothetical protein